VEYRDFSEILNRHILKREKSELLKKMADNPNRFTGLFRPSKPQTKVIQYLLQSREIRFGDALEEVIGKLLEDAGFTPLEKKIESGDGQELALDQLFTKENTVLFIEQKVRDDHDSTKKRGQIANFEAKLRELTLLYPERPITGIMYFIDPTLKKNRNFYTQKLEELREKYSVSLHLFYGKELFEHLKLPELWEELLGWLKMWKNSLPETPELNFDRNPEESFEEIKKLQPGDWKKILKNDSLWEEGIMGALFKSGETLRLLLNHFTSSEDKKYRELAELLKERLESHYSRSQ